MLQYLGKGFALLLKSLNFEKKMITNVLGSVYFNWNYKCLLLNIKCKIHKSL